MRIVCLSADINVLNNDLSHLTSIPVQCTQELPVYFHKKPQPLSAASHNSEAQCHLNGFCQKAGTVSDVLAEDMSKFSMDWPQWREECKKLEQWRAPLPSKWKGACFSDSKTSGQAVQTCSDRTLHTAKVVFNISILAIQVCPFLKLPVSYSVQIRCQCQTALPTSLISWASLVGCWCQMCLCSHTSVTFARQFSLGTQPPKESSCDIFTPTLHRQCYTLHVKKLTPLLDITLTLLNYILDRNDKQNVT